MKITRPKLRRLNEVKPFKIHYNIASKFVQSNSIARACFIFLLCTLMTSTNKCLENSVSDFLHFAFKNGRNFQQNVKLQMATREPADEEAHPTFSLGLEFLTPEKNLKKRKKEDKARDIVSRKTINFHWAPISLSQREKTPFRNDKLKEKLLRNTR